MRRGRKPGIGAQILAKTPFYRTVAELAQQTGANPHTVRDVLRRPWSTAGRHFTIEDDGLSCEWHGRVWCNPPFGREAVKWLRRMIAHQPANKPIKQVRRPGVMPREEYQVRARELAPRGMALPQTKLLPLQVQAIREAVALREKLRREITEKYSNAALAKAFGVHVRPIEKCVAYETHIQRSRG